MSSSAFDDVSMNHSLFIRAGAGAGKTTQLISSFMDFVTFFYTQNKRYPKIVITTFTNKATQEVKERLLIEALKRSNQAVFEYINKKSFVQISTIHGLLHLFIIQNTEALSLPNEIKIVDSFQYDRQLKKIVYQIMKSHEEFTDLLDSYSFINLLEVLKWAVNYKYQHNDIKYVTDDLLEKITLEKKSRILTKLKLIFESVPAVPEKWQDYFDFLKNYFVKVQSGHVKEAIDFFENEPKKPSFLKKNPPFPEEVSDLIISLQKEEKFLYQDTKEYRRSHTSLNQLFLKFVELVFESILQLKQRTGELTTDDLENYSLKLIHEHPQLAQEFSNSWDYFMIDEYQDTSPLQVKILNQIVSHKPCFIVGDPQQSIYLFRGARSEVFNEKESEYLKNNWPTRILNTNYRSEPGLMAFINDYFSQFKQTFQPMLLKEAKTETVLKNQVFYVRTYDEVKAVIKQITFMLNQGLLPKDICVLARKNSVLVKIAQLAYKMNIPVQLQASSGYESKREILDLVAFLKFLVNPSDSENLVTLIRSPWLFFEDENIVNLSQTKEAQFSLWSALLAKKNHLTERLQNYLIDFQTIGASLTLKKYILETGFLICSELLDPTGKREANVWKLLTQLSQQEKQSGFSLSLFLEEQFQNLQADLSSSSREAQPVIQPDRVSLLTVHASKGLEFKHVIIVGFTDKPQVTNSMQLAFDPQSAVFSLSVFSEEQSKLVSSNWSQAQRKEFNKRELLESERMLYVAMTRAQQSLSLISELPQPDQRQSNSSDCWYKKTLWPENSFSTEFYSVQSEFYEDDLEKLQKSAQKQIEIRPLFLKQKEIVTDQMSVTEILSQTQNSILGSHYLNKKFHNLKKAQKGTDLHRLFESLKYLSESELLQMISNEDQVLIQYLLNQNQLSLKEILTQGHNEWGFGIQSKNGILQGQIDAWAELENEIHILDYKTGGLDSFQKAYDQLTIYSFALIKMKLVSTNKKIIQSVVYPIEQKILQRSFADSQDLMKKEPVFYELFL